MKNQKTIFIVQAGIIAALYCALTLIFAPISFGEIQVRIAEGLTILPIFTPAAIPGLFVGCLVGNFLGGAIPIDIVVGSLTTLLASFITYSLRKHYIMAPVPPIILNGLIIPFVLIYGYGVPIPYYFLAIFVAAGEIISCGVIGLTIIFAIKNSNLQGILFKNKQA